MCGILRTLLALLAPHQHALARLLINGAHTAKTYGSMEFLASTGYIVLPGRGYDKVFNDCQGVLQCLPICNLGFLTLKYVELCMAYSFVFILKYSYFKLFIVD